MRNVRFALALATVSASIGLVGFAGPVEASPKAPPSSYTASASGTQSPSNPANSPFLNINGAAATLSGNTLNLLVMGDSYSAGNGAGGYYGAKGCFRSRNNYAEVFADTVRSGPYNRTVNVTNVACSGAVTADIFNKKSGRPAELDAVNSTYNAIFLTIGGNDVKFPDIVKYCLVAKTRDGANCNVLLNNAEAMLNNGTMLNQVTNVLRAVRAKASPSAHVVLLGYPYLEGDPNYTLRSGHGTNGPIIHVGSRVRGLNDAADVLQQAAMHTVASENSGTNNKFISVHDLFDGPPYHGLYAQQNNPDRWMVQPFVDASIATYQTWYHPNPTGWREEGNLLVSSSGLFSSLGSKDNVLIYGDGDADEDATGMDNLNNALTASGFTVTTMLGTTTLPADLSSYGQIWHYGIDSSDVADQVALETFVQNGGSVFLTGDWGTSSNFGNPGNEVILNALLPTPITFPGDGQFVPGLPVNSSVIDGAAITPNQLTTWTATLVGGISGVDPANVLFSNSSGHAAGALWEIGSNGGRLAILMDVNWAQTRFADATTMPQVAQNIAYFLSVGIA